MAENTIKKADRAFMEAKELSRDLLAASIPDTVVNKKFMKESSDKQKSLIEKMKACSASLNDGLDELRNDHADKQDEAQE